jgi:hypothetical protein
LTAAQEAAPDIAWDEAAIMGSSDDNNNNNKNLHRGWYDVDDTNPYAGPPPRKRRRRGTSSQHQALVSLETIATRQNAWTTGPYQIEIPITPEGLLLRIALYRGRPCFLGYLPTRNGRPGPAQVRNLLADRFDVLVAIDQVSITGWEFSAVRSLLRQHRGQRTRRLGFLPGRPPLLPKPPVVVVPSPADSDDENDGRRVETPREVLVEEEDDDDNNNNEDDDPTPTKVRFDDSDENSSDDDDDKADDNAPMMLVAKAKTVVDLTPGSSESERDSDFEVSDHDDASNDDEELHEAMMMGRPPASTGRSAAPVFPPGVAHGKGNHATAAQGTTGATMPRFQYPTLWPSNFGPPRQTANQATADSRMAMVNRPGMATGMYANNNNNNNNQQIPNVGPLYYQPQRPIGANQLGTFQALQAQIHGGTPAVPAEYTVALPVMSRGGLGVEVGNFYQKVAVLSTPAMDDGTPNRAAGRFRSPCDYIVAVDGTRVEDKTFDDVVEMLRDHQGKTLRMLVMRDKTMMS